MLPEPSLSQENVSEEITTSSLLTYPTTVCQGFEKRRCGPMNLHQEMNRLHRQEDHRQASSLESQ